jgi:SWI/SNF-related matrix-associated actin-dependent regulator 1 of chromatin subfamily A
VSFLERRNGRALLADDQGLGKTIQTLAYLSLHKQFRGICVCPATVKWNWEAEAKKWASHLHTYVVNGRTPHRLSFKYNFVIINYDILKDWEMELKKWGPDVIIGDEIHFCKNVKSQRSRAFDKVTKNCEHIIGLTGTPIVNAPVEFYHALKIIDPALFPSYWRFAQRYCGAKHNGFGWDFKGSSNEEELYHILTKDSGIMKRRMKVDVLPELPPVTHSIIPLHISSTEMKDAEESLKDALKTEDTMNMLAAIEHMRQVCLEVKMPQVIDWVKDFLENCEEKLVVFGWHKIGIHQLKECFQNSVVIDGSITGIKRHEEIIRFRTDKNIRLMFGNIKAAGIGINLTEASHCLFIELPWNPSELRQCVDRLNRFGQLKPVNVWYLLIANSIETTMMDMIDRKAEIISMVLDGKKISETALLRELLKKGLEKK